MPGEIVRCRCDDGRKLVVFCRYETDAGVPRYERQGTVAYEAGVYEAPRPSRLLPIRCFGLARTPTWPTAWLVTEYHDRCVRAGEPSVQPFALEAAAKWIGRFQASQAEIEVERDLSALLRYTVGYYAGGIDRALSVAASLPDYDASLRAARRGYRELVELLVSSPVAIHGDFYAGNVLYRDSAMYPIDRGWAALAAGEIDLVTLVERWPQEVVKQCDRAYQEARWPAGSPNDYGMSRDVARL